MEDWSYENEQWTKLPTYLRHLPLFSRHTDLTSIFFRILWSFFLQEFIFKFYVRLNIQGGNYHEIFRLTPQELDIRELGLAFLKLGRYQVDEAWFF